MDCFFVACEVKRDPSLRGKSVVVGAAGNRGVVCTASYEARALGVGSATPIGEARRRCPDALYLPVDGKLYQEESRAVIRILRALGTVRQVSIDEAYLDVTELVTRIGSWQATGEHLRRCVLDGTGLSCSVGLALSKRVAKIASDFRKPGGVTTVEDMRGFLAPLPIESFPGIGPVTKRYFHAQGIHTIGDLATLDRFTVIERFGHHAVPFHAAALGEERSHLTARGKAKSVGRERTYMQDLREQRAMLSELHALCERAREDLDGRYARRVTLKVRYADFTTLIRDVTLQTPTRDTRQFIAAAEALFGTVEQRPMRLLGVRLSRLHEHCGEQLLLSEFLAQSI